MSLYPQTEFKVFVGGFPRPQKVGLLPLFQEISSDLPFHASHHMHINELSLISHHSIRGFVVSCNFRARKPSDKVPPNLKSLSDTVRRHQIRATLPRLRHLFLHCPVPRNPATDAKEGCL